MTALDIVQVITATFLVVNGAWNVWITVIVRRYRRDVVMRQEEERTQWASALLEEKAE